MAGDEWVAAQKGCPLCHNQLWQHRSRGDLWCGVCNWSPKMMRKGPPPPPPAPPDALEILGTAALRQQPPSPPPPPPPTGDTNASNTRRPAPTLDEAVGHEKDSYSSGVKERAATYEEGGYDPLMTRGKARFDIDSDDHDAKTPICPNDGYVLAFLEGSMMKCGLCLNRFTFDQAMQALEERDQRLRSRHQETEKERSSTFLAHKGLGLEQEGLGKTTACPECGYALIKENVSSVWWSEPGEAQAYAYRCSWCEVHYEPHQVERSSGGR